MNNEATSKELSLLLEREHITNQLLQISQISDPLAIKLKKGLDVLLTMSWLKRKNQGGVFLYENNELNLVEFERLSPELHKLCAKIKLGQCLCGRAAQIKEIIHADCVDDRHDVSFASMSPHGHYNIPLIFEGTLHGVIVLYLDHGHKKSEIEIEFLKSVGNVFAHMVNHHKQVEALETQKVKTFQSAKMANIMEMAGGMAHEIHSPLSVVKMSIFKLRSESIKKGNDEETLKTLDKMDASVDRIVKIINNLRIVSSRESEREVKLTDINKAITETLEFYTERFKEKNIRIEKDIPLEVTEVLIDESEAKQIIFCLIENAIAAIKDESEPLIRFEVIDAEGKVLIRALDNGSGIVDEIKEKIFIPFFTTKEIGQGTGLGLSVAKGLVESYDGKIYLDSDKERTCFCLELPKIKT